MAKTETASVEETPRAKVTKRKSVSDVPKVIPFFQRVASIAKEDWGKRASLKLYRLEPVINRLATSDNKFINIYAEPVDEERIKQDFGSGRYRLYLNYKLPNESEGKELDSMEFDILDMKFPPKIPFGEWVDAPKNKDWAWAKEKLQPPTAAAAAAQTASAGLVDTLRAFNEIQDSAVERARANTPAPSDPLAIVKGVFDLMPKSAPSSEIPMFQALMTNMAAQSEQQTKILMAQIAASQAESKDLRAELREMRQHPQHNGGGGLSFVKELIGEVKTILPDLKDFFPGERTRNTAWWVGTLENLSQGIAPVLPLLVQRYMSQPPQPQAPQQFNNPGLPAPRPGIPQQYQPQTTGPNIDLEGMLLSAMDKHEPGESLAHALDTYFGPDGQRFYEGLRNMGEAGLIQTLQQQPVWNRLGVHQQRVPEFVKQFIAYGNDEGDEAEVVHGAETLESEPTLEVL